MENQRTQNFEETQREGTERFCARMCVYFACLSIAIAKIRDYSQSSPLREHWNIHFGLTVMLEQK